MKEILVKVEWRGTFTVEVPDDYEVKESDIEDDLWEQIDANQAQIYSVQVKEK